MSRKVATLLAVALMGVGGIFYYLRQSMPASEPVIEKPKSCPSEEEYVLGIRKALSGNLALFKDLLKEGEFSAGVMESDDTGPLPVEEFVNANQDVDLSKIQIEESHAYFKVSNWKYGQALFLFPKRIENCIYLTGAYVGSPELSLEQVESWQQE